MSKTDTSPGDRESQDRARQFTANIPDELLHDGTDWDRILAMSDEEAYRNALEDEDNPPLTTRQLARMRRAPNLKAIRRRLRMNQEQFARQFQIAVGTIRDWEQGIHTPDSAATAYLRVIELEPEAVLRALHPAERDLELEVRPGTAIHYWPAYRITTVPGAKVNRPTLCVETDSVSTTTVGMQFTAEPIESAA